jgi:hypothetical protein
MQLNWVGYRFRDRAEWFQRLNRVIEVRCRLTAQTPQVPAQERVYLAHFSISIVILSGLAISSTDELIGLQFAKTFGTLKV